MKTRPVIEFILFSGLVLIIYIGYDLVPAIGFAIAVLLGYKAAKRYIIKAFSEEKRQRKSDIADKDNT